MSAATADLPDRWTVTWVRRWLVSFILVLALHVAVALVVLFRHVPMTPANPPQAPVLMDLAPLPAKPLNIHPLPASPPENPVKPPTPQVQPQAQPQPATTPPTPAAPQPQASSPLLPPSTAAAEPRIIVPPPPEVAEAPVPSKPVVQRPATQTPSTPALPILPMPNAQENSLSAWQRKVIARLYSLNRLPPGMPQDEASATVDVLINVDRNGHIVYFKIVRPSGFPTLDHAVRSLMRHADPLPPPPPPPIDILNAPQSFVLTIGYYNLPN